MQQRNITNLAIIFALVILTGYVYIKFIPPPENLNSILINAADPFTTLLAAISVTAVLLCYQKDDKPYAVWLSFTIGMWFWVFAETLYGYLEFSVGESPPPGLSDILWFIGYGLLAVALYNQYQLVAKNRIALWKPIAVLVAVVLVNICLLFLFNIPLSTENFVNYLYPIVDFAICIFAFRLYMVFGDGKLSHPWMGLFVLGIADGIWAWIYFGGGDQVNALTIFGDTSYIAAYLILAIAFLRQYLLLHFGPE